MSSKATPKASSKPSSSPIISVTGLSKCYQIWDTPSARLKQPLLNRVRRSLGRPGKKYFREFWALRDVSFEIERGQSVGIVGRNGSGKSTLLQMICGTLSPSTGTVKTQGRIAALLELGSAFNPEFTGRENVFLNGAVLGMPEAEIARRFDEIVDFAGVDSFIDQPVKTYSSGMRLRLAFSVQAQLEPDILVVDEALAVGDARFQAKCFARLRTLKENGTSILLVTHATEQVVTHCDRAVLLDGGSLLQVGEPRDIVNRYLDLLFGRQGARQDNRQALAAAEAIDVTPESPLEHNADVFAKRPGYNPHEYRWGDGSAAILDFCLKANEVAYPTTVATGAALSLTVSIAFYQSLVRPILGVTIKTKEGVTVYGVNSERLECTEMRDFGVAESVIVVTTDFKCRLAPGDYFVSLGLASRQIDGVVPHDRRYDSIHIHVGADDRLFGLVDLDAKINAVALKAPVDRGTEASED